MKRHLWVSVAALGSLLALVVPLRAAMIDDFEDGNLDEWSMTPDPIGAVVTAAAAHDGQYGVELRSVRTGWIYRTDDQAQLSWGNTMSAWSRLSFGMTRNYHGFGTSPNGTYSAILAPNTSTLIIQYNVGLTGYEDLAAVPHTWVLGQWYRIEVVWEAGGIITANLYGEDGCTLLNTVTTVDTRISEGGIALRSFGTDAAYVDTITRDESPSGVEMTTWGEVKSLFR